MDVICGAIDSLFAEKEIFCNILKSTAPRFDRHTRSSFLAHNFAADRPQNARHQRETDFFIILHNADYIIIENRSQLNFCSRSYFFRYGRLASIFLKPSRKIENSPTLRRLTKSRHQKLGAKHPFRNRQGADLIRHVLRKLAGDERELGPFKYAPVLIDRQKMKRRIISLAQRKTFSSQALS